MNISMYVAGQSEVGPMIENVKVDSSPADIGQGEHYREAEDAVNLDPPCVVFEEREFIKALRTLLPGLIEAGLSLDMAYDLAALTMAERPSKRSKPRFFKTVIRVVMLSDQPYAFDDLRDVHDDMTTGDFSGRFEVVESVEVDGPTMAMPLKAQGSETESFKLTDSGEDMT